MLDAIFRPNGGERKQGEIELRDLLAEVREERAAVREEREAAREEREAMRAEREALVLHIGKAGGAISKLARTNKALDEVAARADAAMRKVEVMAAAAAGQDERVRNLDKVDQRVQELLAQVAQADRASKALLEPEGPIHKQRKALDDFGAQARDAQAALQDLSKDGEKRIASLHAMVEHVSQKAKALETQRHAVDHATTETARLSEMVWAMEAQVTKFAEGREQMQRAEDAVARMEKLSRGATQELAAATAAREEFVRESARIEGQGRTLLETLRATADRLAVDKEEFGAFDERLKSLSAALADTETRMQGVLAKNEPFTALQHKADSLGKVFADLRTDIEDLARKQSALDDLTERLGLVEALGRRTAVQHDSLMQAQGDLEGMRTGLADMQGSYREAARLREQAAQDRGALEGFVERASAMIGRTPEIEARLQDMLGKMALLEEGNQSVRRLGEATAGLDAELTRVSGRMQFVEKLDERVNGLFSLTMEVERRMGEQQARRTQIEGLEKHCESLGVQIGNVQHQLESVSSQQGRLQPLAAEVARLGEALEASRSAALAMKKGETAALEQQTRLAGLIEHGMRQAAETSDHLRHVQVLSQDLTQVAARSDEVMGQLAQVQSRQRDVLAQVSLTEEQMQRAEAMSRQLDQRRTLLMHTEKTLVNFESRLADLDRHADGLETKMKALADREALIQAVKAEVDGIRQISSRSKADLQFVTEHRNDVTDLRTKVDDLLGRIGDTDGKIVVIESWRTRVEEAKAGAEQITVMLGDMQGTLENLSEQRVVIDDVGEKLARLDFSLQEAQHTLARLDTSAQEAQGTMRTLQREREVAERVEKSIKAVRARGSSPAA